MSSINDKTRVVSKALNRLTTTAVANLTRQGKSVPGTYHDGGGLYLQISKSQGASWLFRYMYKGVARGMGLGPLAFVSLKEARIKSQECRILLWKDTDPLESRKQQAQAGQPETATGGTFKDCALAYVGAHRSGWKNAKHADQWKNTLETYAYPVIGDLPVAQVDIALVKKILEPIWRTKTETASRLRGRIESILDWATVHGYRTGDNPARWRGRLDILFPRQSRVATVQHHPALPYAEIATFMSDLGKQDGVAAVALEFLILTATRTSEVINSTWSEINLDQAVWTIPRARMKAGKEHRIPLSAPTLALLAKMKDESDGDHVFPGRQRNKPLSNMAMLQLLKRMGRTDLTAHGFRSTFRDWSAECTNHPREVQEAALAHTLVNKTEAAYQRGDLFEKRVLLMRDWAIYCCSPAPQ